MPLNMVIDIAVAIRTISRALDSGIIDEKEYEKLNAHLKELAEKNDVKDNDYILADEQIDMDGRVAGSYLAPAAKEYLDEFEADR
jgi:DNA-binding MltR family transcriptional regulator